MKKQIKSIDFLGKKGAFTEIHVTNTRGKQMAILLKNDKFQEAMNKKTEKDEEVKEEFLKEINDLIRLKILTGLYEEELDEFEKHYKREMLKEKQLFYTKTYLRVPSGANWSLYDYIIMMVNDEGKIEDVTYLFTYLTHSKNTYELHFGSGLKEYLRKDGFRINQVM